MVNKIQLRRGTNAEREAVILDSGEPGWTTDTKDLYVGDGETLGGNLVTGVKAATFVVAASDSLHKERADYVCDGVDDQVEIQAALDALPAYGGSLALLDGLYRVTGIVSINKDNVHIFGRGARIGSPSGVPLGAFFINANHIEIANVVFTSQDASAQSNFRPIRGAYEKNTYDVNIHDCSFLARVISGADRPANKDDSTMLKPIETGAAVGWMIYHNYFEKFGYEAISCSIYTIGDKPFKPSHVVISENVLKDGYAGIAVEGGAKYCQIINNTAKGLAATGIHLWHNDTNHTLVAGNVLEADSGTTAVYTDFGDDVYHGIIANNIFKHFACGINSYKHEFQVVGNTIISNGSNSASAYGIYLRDGVVSNNTIYGFRYGVHGGGRVTNNKICNCFEGGEGIVGATNVFNNYIYNCHNKAIGAMSGIEHIENNSLLRHSGASTTLTADASAGSVSVTVADVTIFTFWEYITIDAGGGAAENNQIKDFDFLTKQITLDSPLANDHSSGENVDTRKVMTYGINATLDNPDGIVKNNYIEIDIASSNYPYGYKPYFITLSEQHVDLFMDVLAVSTTHVRSNEDLSAATPITFTIDAQPDVPRTLSGHFDSHAQITEYDIEVIGVDAKGKTVTETKDESDGWDWETNNAFTTITSIKMTARTGTGAGDTMDVGITDVLGLSSNLGLHPIVRLGCDVYKIKKNNANVAVASAQVNTTYNTYDMSVIGLAATNDFTIWYKTPVNKVG